LREVAKHVIKLMIEMKQPTEPEVRRTPGRKETETTKEKVTAGFAHFGDLFTVEGLDEHTPPELQDSQERFVGFLTDRIGKSFEKASGEGRDNLSALAETLSGLPQNIAEFRRSKDKRKASLTIEGPTSSVDLDINLGGKGRTQRIRLGLRDAKGNETLVLDIHYYLPKKRLQMELRGNGLGEGILEHRDFPIECSDQETITQLQLSLIFNLCPTKGEDDKATARYLAAKETYLNMLLKKLGLKGESAADREELIAEIMARYPGTTQHQRVLELEQNRKKEEQRAKEMEEERQKQLELVTQCANKLNQIITKTPPLLTRWLTEQREKWELPPEITDGQIVLGFILDIPPDELDKYAEDCELPRGEKTLIPDIPDLTAQAIQKTQDLGKPAEDALQYMRDLAKAMRSYEE